MDVREKPPIACQVFRWRNSTPRAVNLNGLGDSADVIRPMTAQSVVRTAQVRAAFWPDYEVTAKLLTGSDSTQPAPNIEDNLEIASCIFYINVKQAT
jgi:hypothetical protein